MRTGRRPTITPLIRSYGWFDAWWEQAAEVPSPAFAVNAPVLVLPDRQEGQVRRRDYDHGEWFYDVRLDGGTKNLRESTLAAPEIDDDPFDWIARPADPARRLAATITRAKLSEDLTDTVYSFRASRTIFRPYQFRPDPAAARLAAACGCSSPTRSVSARRSRPAWSGPSSTPAGRPTAC